MNSYKNQVVEEFTEAAEKFGSLNKFCIDLHHHLAKSANKLCDEAAAGTLLEASLSEKSTERLKDMPSKGRTEDYNPVEGAETIAGPELGEASVQVDFEEESQTL